MTTLVRPGGQLATRPLHFIFIVDTSTSMKYNGKIDALNNAISQAIPHMRRVADDNPNANVLVRAIAFSSGAEWLISEPTPVETFQWQPVTAAGVTDLGRALELLSEALAMPPMDARALPPVLVLISDGIPTDDYQPQLDKLLAMPWGVKAVKLAIGIGGAISTTALKAFINNDAIDVLQADNPEALIEYIKWASTVVLQAASAPASQIDASTSGNIFIPKVPDDFWDDLSVSLEDVW